MWLRITYGKVDLMEPVSLEHFRGGGLVDGCDDLELGEGLPGFHHHGPLELELSGLHRRKLVVLVRRHLEVERLALVDLLRSGEGRLVRVRGVENRRKVAALIPVKNRLGFNFALQH